jgi:hypothetical protein
MTNKIQPVTAWAVVNKDRPKLDISDFYYTKKRAKEYVSQHNLIPYELKVIKVLITPQEQND